MCLFPEPPEIPEVPPPTPPPPEVKPMKFKEKSDPREAKRTGTKRLQVPPGTVANPQSGVST